MKQGVCKCVCAYVRMATTKYQLVGDCIFT